jgi:hypothetical protein
LNKDLFSAFRRIIKPKPLSSFQDVIFPFIRATIYQVFACAADYFANRSTSCYHLSSVYSGHGVHTLFRTDAYHFVRGKRIKIGFCGVFALPQSGWVRVWYLIKPACGFQLVQSLAL